MFAWSRFSAGRHAGTSLSRVARLGIRPFGTADALADWHARNRVVLPAIVQAVDLASIIVNLGIFIATVLAAIIAWRGVRDAQRARDAAADYEAQALAHAERSASAAAESATAQQRAAEALEQANRREEARDAQRTPWIVAKVGSGRWRVTNNSGGIATDVDVEALGGEDVQMEDGQQLRDVAAGQPMFVHFGGGFADPPTATLRVEWNDSMDRAQSAVVVLG